MARFGLFWILQVPVLGTIMVTSGIATGVPPGVGLTVVVLMGMGIDVPVGRLNQ